MLNNVAMRSGCLCSVALLHAAQRPDCYGAVRYIELWRPSLHLLSSSRTSVPVKQGLFNAKIHNENGRYIHRLIYELNEQDLLCHSR